MLGTLEPSLYMWPFVAFFPPGAPSKGVYDISVRAKEPCPLRSGWCLGLLTWPTLHQKQLRKTNCWARDLWMLVGPVAGVTPMTRLQNLPRLQSCCDRGPCFVTRCPEPHILFRDRNPALLHTLISDCWLRNEYSIRLIVTRLKQVDT